MTNTISNPMDSQREELILARLQRDHLQYQLDEIATALYVRADIECENNVPGGVNELLDNWEEMCEREAQRNVDELRDQLKLHKTPLNAPDKFRTRFFGGEDGE